MTVVTEAGHEIHIGEQVRGLEQVDAPGVTAAENNPASHVDEKAVIDEKAAAVDEKAVGSDLESGSISSSHEEVIRDAKGLVTKIISLDDDPTLPVLTFRFWFLGLGLSIFGAVLGQIYYFKPQTLLVSTLFLEVISYIMGAAMAKAMPNHGFFAYLNPGPFNIKEHAAIVIMSSTSSTSALGIELLAVDRLFYSGISPNAVTSIFTLLSSQLIGYGFAGLLRSVLVYPTLNLYPSLLPQVNLFEALNKHAGLNAKRLKVFWITFFILFFWEIIPVWIFPLLVGFSVFCLAQQHKPIPAFTNFFGGSNGNEGLGFGSFCFDWQFVGAGGGGLGALYAPLQSQVNQWIGLVLCYATFMGVYYGNVWNAQSFPFLAQDLFQANGSLYDQTQILDANNEFDPVAYEKYGQPYFATTWAVQLLTNNLAITATITHILLWHWNDVTAAWKEYKSGDSPDPHYTLMQKYKEAPMWWYGAIFLASFVVAEVTNYTGHSGLPWWSLIIALILSFVFTAFTGELYAITGFNLNIQPVVQMIGGYIHPGKPVANMYFTLYGYATQGQALLMLRDLKLGQYVKIPPRHTFLAQVVGTVVGAIFNWIMMNQIIDAQYELLLSPVGNTIWSGQQPQNYNSQAISWGALGKQMFAHGTTYFWVPMAFVIGFLGPLPFYFLHKFFPKARFDYLNGECRGRNDPLTFSPHHLLVHRQPFRRHQLECLFLGRHWTHQVSILQPLGLVLII